MEIRKVRLEDSDSIQSLSSQLGYDYSIEKVKNKLICIINNPDHQVFVASDANKVIGYIHVELYRTLFYDDVLNILGIVVDAFARNNGVGTALLQAIEAWAKRKNCKGIRANSGATRENAHCFYKHNGFDNGKDQKRFMKIFNV